MQKLTINFVLTSKEMHENKCQVCNLAISTPFGSLSEADHIQGIGSPHFGADVIGKLLILCPNHHTVLESYSYFVQITIQFLITLVGMFKIIGK